MPRARSAEDLTVDELRQLLIEKRRARRQKRIDTYRRTGRVILVEQAPTVESIETLRSTPIEPAATPAEVTSARRRTFLRTFADRALFLIEAAAVLGLVWIFWNGATVVKSLNAEVASVLSLPTLTPTAIISEVVLPSGHVPPVNGVTQFNENEIPEHLRPLVQSLNVAVVVPTPSPEHAQKIKIPALNVFAPVVQGDGWEQLKKGVGQHLGTPHPGPEGNIVLSAHNDVFGELFRDLDKLKPGDEIILYTQLKAYTYVVRQTQIVSPMQIDVLSQTREPVVTLISCYPYMVDNQRIVVTADLVSQ